eukprot:scaffold89356_cov36-Phaeocystis_antarctica.AAC.1
MKGGPAPVEVGAQRRRDVAAQTIDSRCLIQPCSEPGGLGVAAYDQPRWQRVAGRHVQHDDVAKVDCKCTVPLDAPKQLGIQHEPLHIGRPPRNGRKSMVCDIQAAVGAVSEIVDNVHGNTWLAHSRVIHGLVSQGVHAAHQSALLVALLHEGAATVRITREAEVCCNDCSDQLAPCGR